MHQDPKPAVLFSLLFPELIYMFKNLKLSRQKLQREYTNNEDIPNPEK